MMVGCCQGIRRPTLVVALLIGLIPAGCGHAPPPRVVMLQDALSPEEHLALGVAYEREGNRDLARSEYEAVLNRRPDQVQAAVNLGNLAVADGDFAAAEAWYRRAVRIGGKEAAPAANNLAWVYLTQGKRLSLAEKRARDAIAWDPQPAYYDTLIIVLIKSEQPLDAGKVLDEAESLAHRDPGDTDPFADRKRELAELAYAQGKALVQKKRYQSAEALIREAVRRDPSRASVYLGTLAEALLVSGNPREATQAIDEAEERSGTDPKTQDLLSDKKRELAEVAHAQSKELLGKGRLDSAETLVREAIRWNPPRTPHYLITLADVLIAEEKPYEAGEVIDQAEALVPTEDADLRARLYDSKAGLFVSMGLMSEAQAAAQQAAALRKVTVQ